MRFQLWRVAYALQTGSAMRGLDPATLSKCALMPATISSHALTATRVSRWKSRPSQGFLAVDPSAASRSGRCTDQLSPAYFSSGKAGRFGYAAGGVGLLLTPLGQSTAVQAMPQWMGAIHAPLASGAEQQEVVPMGLHPRGVFTGESGSSGNGWLSRDRITRVASRGGVVV